MVDNSKNDMNYIYISKDLPVQCNNNCITAFPIFNSYTTENVKQDWQKLAVNKMSVNFPCVPGVQ